MDTFTRTDDRGVLPDEVPIGVTLDRTCIGCGAAYQWTSREGWQWPTSYCTRKCKRGSAQQRIVKLDGAADEAPEGMRLLVCARCGESFGWRPRGDGQLRPPVYCSTACGYAVKTRRRKERRDAGAAAKAQRRAEHEAAVAAKQQRLAERAAREGRIEEANRLRRELEQQQRTAAAEQRQRDERHAQLAAAAEKAEWIAAESTAARELLLTGGRCTTCGKVASSTKEAARDAKRTIEQRSGRTNDVRYYQCDGGWWHWTRQDATLEGWRARR